ncbi:uncharacterized protein DUF58 [Roseateles asaccharophilus]|uniref:Uncharacterized protein DUF58 n=2 Tax=Roseateles asaccharophilus TaxID=582607 RepID=A0A4R6MQN9_9BURK|nr:uncharacterized protein DUF58 [Roseateles asaccharophilus]
MAGPRSFWPWRRTSAAEPAPAAAGVYLDWQQLLGLEFAARRVRWPPQQASARSLLAGRHRSRVRGRGLDFIELRQYQPGDDTRTIDWRASARTGRTHVRVYAEERDRPTWLVADQRISMFFARRGSLRSVVAAEAAAVWGWRALAGGDRVGGLVIADDGLDEVMPGRGRRSLLQFLERLRSRNHALRADSPVPPAPAQLDAALQRLVQQAPRDAVIAIFSDFDGLGERSRSLLLELARHNDLVLLPIWEDASTTTQGVRLVVSDGQAQLPIDHGDRRVIEGLATLARERSERLRGLRAELGCAVLPLLNTEPALLQLARGLDKTPPSAARL